MGRICGLALVWVPLAAEPSASLQIKDARRSNSAQSPPPTVDKIATPVGKAAAVAGAGKIADPTIAEQQAATATTTVADIAATPVAAYEIPQQLQIVHGQQKFELQHILNWCSLHGSFKVPQGQFQVEDKELAYYPNRTPGKRIVVVADVTATAEGKEDDEAVGSELGSKTATGYVGAVQPAVADGSSVSGSVDDTGASSSGSFSASGSRGSFSGSFSGSGSGSVLERIPLSMSEPSFYRPTSFPKLPPGCGEDLPDEMGKRTVSRIMQPLLDMKRRTLQDAAALAQTSSDNATALLVNTASNLANKAIYPQLVRSLCEKGVRQRMQESGHPVSTALVETTIEKCVSDTTQKLDSGKATATTTLLNQMNATATGIQAESHELAHTTGSSAVLEAYATAVEAADAQQEIKTAATKAYNFASHWVRYGHKQVKQEIAKATERTAHAESKSIAERIGGLWVLDQVKEKAKKAVDSDLQADVNRIAEQIGQHAVEELWSLDGLHGKIPVPVIHFPPLPEGSGSGSFSGSPSGSAGSVGSFGGFSASGAGSGPAESGSSSATALQSEAEDSEPKKQAAVPTFLQERSSRRKKLFPFRQMHAANIQPEEEREEVRPQANEVLTSAGALAHMGHLLLHEAGRFISSDSVGPGGVGPASFSSPSESSSENEKSGSSGPSVGKLARSSGSSEQQPSGSGSFSASVPPTKTEHLAPCPAFELPSFEDGRWLPAADGGLPTVADNTEPPGAIGQPVPVAQGVRAWRLLHGGYAFRYKQVPSLLVRFFNGKAEYLWSDMYVRHTPLQRDFWTTDGTKHVTEYLDGKRVYQTKDVVTVEEVPNVSVKLHYCNPNREVSKTVAGVSYIDGASGRNVFRTDDLDLTSVETPVQVGGKAEKELTVKARPLNAEQEGALVRDAPDSVQYYFPDEIVEVKKADNSVTRTDRAAVGSSP
ncbi:unnamed protein product [Amoebophrya sp. A120]|nr:unnamed protein product [Amoebophrya sp. A120]|eukprot:GSA120T00005432001.1